MKCSLFFPNQKEVKRTAAVWRNSAFPPVFNTGTERINWKVNKLLIFLKLGGWWGHELRMFPQDQRADRSVVMGKCNRWRGASW